MSPIVNPTERYYFDRRTQEILENLSIPFAIYQYIDKRVVTITLSRGFCDLFGIKTLKEAYYTMNNDMYRSTHPDDKARVADAAYRFAAFDNPYDIVYRTRTLKDTGYTIIHSYGSSIYPEPGIRLCLTWYAPEGHYSAEEGIYGSILNQTLNHFLTEESRYRGMYYDYMTGLPNLVYFYELAEAGRGRMKEEKIDSAIIYFDLTGLKQFNRRHGFAGGDNLIRELAVVLSRNFSNENCARFAQDHFAAFAPEEGLTDCLDRVIRECDSINDGKTLPLRIGVYPDRIEEVDIGTACDRARMAADVLKKLNRSCYSFFSMEMMEEEKNRQEIIDHIDQAIEEGWIEVFYQPIIRSGSGKVCDLEALARWRDKKRGLLMPSSFISVLEEAMLIHKLDLYVVKQVLKDLKSNEEKGIQNVPVSINFSRADFDVYDLVNEICSLMDEAGVDRRFINIEITESIVGSDFNYMKEQIDRFRSQGFQVWMDDFGSGYSSLELLQCLKFDLIKFDMGFMRRLDQGKEGKIILTEMMKMANSLGADTICEGVETEEQVRFLQEIRCSKLQGYFFMKPAPAEQVLRKYTEEIGDGFEDPREAAYYDLIRKLNLNDLSFLYNSEYSISRYTFESIPMGIMEINSDGDKIRYFHFNQSFREFMKRFFQVELSFYEREYSVVEDDHGLSIRKAIEQCRNNDNRSFFDEVLEDGSVIHSFLRGIKKNPVDGSEAFAFVMLSVREPDK